MSVGYVYVIQAGDDAVCKIGIAGCPKKRLRTLQIGSPQRLNLVAAFGMPRDKAARVESACHIFLAADRVSGEWFKVHPDLAVLLVAFGEQALPALEKGLPK